MTDLTQYRRVYDPVKEGNPAAIVNTECKIMDCLECGHAVDSADGLCTGCWMLRHDARVDPKTCAFREFPKAATAVS